MWGLSRCGLVVSRNCCLCRMFRPCFLQVRAMRATMKKYRQNKGCRSRRTFKSAEKRLAQLKRDVDKFDQRHAVLLSDRCVCAFVVFNCEDSWRYCVDDYKGSNSWWRRNTQVHHHTPTLRCAGVFTL